MPDNLGVTGKQLTPCPTSQNCVSSIAGEDKDHAIAPLTYSEPFAEARQRLLDTIRSMKRSTIITADERYIHVRSASRVGHSDLGVNRKRIEDIRNRYTP